MDERERRPTPLPAWKRSPVIAGAMMLIKGYAPPVTACDRCKQPLERADRMIHVTFVGREALYACPHCQNVTRRTLRIRRADDGG